MLWGLNIEEKICLTSENSVNDGISEQRLETSLANFVRQLPLYNKGSRTYNKIRRCQTPIFLKLNTLGDNPRMIF